MNRASRFLNLLIYALLFQNVALAHKPYNELYVSHVNLKKYPKQIFQNEMGIETTIGDLHGNALKLTYFLINTGVLKMSTQDYETLVNIYQISPKKLTVNDLKLFQNIIDRAGINNHHPLRFLGDDLCDRGMNDYYTLYIYRKLDIYNVPFEIVLSNHGAFFLEAFEQKDRSFNYNPYGEGKHVSVIQSMLNLGIIIDRGLIEHRDVIEIVQKHYLKHLKLSAYSVNKAKNEIMLYSHAPIDLKILADLAKDMNVPFKDDSLNHLIESLEHLNTRGLQWITGDAFIFYYDEFNKRHKRSGTPCPLKQILWNRDYGILDRDYQPAHISYGINYVHGHDSQSNVFDLDNLLGKGSDNFKGPYAIHMTS